MDELPRFRPRDRKLMRSWEKAAAILNMPGAKPEHRLKAMQDAMRYTWPDLAIVVDQTGWVVYRDGAPEAHEYLDMDWHSGRIRFEVDPSIPDASTVVSEAAQIALPLTEWQHIHAGLEKAFARRPIAAEVLGGHTAAPPFVGVTIRLRRVV